MLCAIFFHFTYGGFSYFSAWCVDDALKCYVIIWVAKRAEICDSVFDFFSIKEFESTENFVGNSFLDEYLFEDLGLTIHSVEDGKVSPCCSFFVFHFGHHADDVSGFFVLITEDENFDGVVAFAMSFYVFGVLVGVVSDKMLTCCDDMWSGAIVDLEFEDVNV